MVTTAPFIILALPRSRTAWLARFLTYGEFHTAHEQARHLRSVADARAWLSQDCTGTVETSVAQWWRLLRHLRPDVRIAVVRRPVDDVLVSLMRLDLRGVCDFDRAILATQLRVADKALRQIERRVPGVLSVSFDDLAREDVCAALFEHVLPHRHDPAWWRQWAGLNVKASMPHLMRHFLAHRPQMARLVADARRHTVALLRRQHPLPVDLGDGVVISEEPFDAVWRDGQALFAEHAAEVGGEVPPGYLNVPLVRKLEAAGAVQILTARCNGRLAGYLAHIIAPSIEDADLTLGIMNTFFVSPDFRGIGPRLQRAAIEALRAKGVGEVILRAGVRGSGPKLASLFARMGAKDQGRMFSLPIAEAA